MIAVAHLLDVAEPASDADVALRVEREERDADVGVAPRVHLRAIHNWFNTAIDNLGRMVRACVGVEKIASCVRIIVRAILIAVTQRELEVLRDDAVLVGELRFALDLLMRSDAL